MLGWQCGDAQLLRKQNFTKQFSRNPTSNTLSFPLLLIYLQQLNRLITRPTRSPPPNSTCVPESAAAKFRSRFLLGIIRIFGGLITRPALITSFLVMNSWKLLRDRSTENRALQMAASVRANYSKFRAHMASKLTQRATAEQRGKPVFLRVND